jgi:hypothetical protein
MKKIFSYYCIIISICISFNNSCADNKHIGNIDMLMLHRAAFGAGNDIIKKAIAYFKPELYRLPLLHSAFEIWFEVSENDNSLLSYAIFDSIKNNHIFKCKNFCNLGLSKSRPELIPIDECTYYRKGKNSGKVDVAIFFFNKQRLVSLYKDLEEHLKSKSHAKRLCDQKE